MSTWLIPFISGVFATALGSVLVMLWDVQKTRQEKKRRERLMLAALREELRTNTGILRANHDLLRRENAMAKTNRSILKPVSLLKDSMFDVMRTNMPDRLAADGALLTKVRDTERFTDQVNETIRSRETFRTTNMGLEQYHATMQHYDRLLMDQGRILLAALEDLEPRL
jgi:hypothetical protein